MVLQHSRRVSALTIDCHMAAFSGKWEAAGRALRPPRGSTSATATGVAGVAATAVRETALGRTGRAIRQPRVDAARGRAADRALQIAVGEIAQRFLVQVELAGDLLLHDT